MARHARRVYVRRRIAVGVAAAILLSGIGLGGYSAFALSAPLPTAAAQAAAPKAVSGAAIAVATPGTGASGIGVVGWEAPLVVAGDTQPRPIASISKVITALVALDAMPIADGGDGASVVLDDDDEQGYYDALYGDESNAPAYAGDVLTERDVLEAMLVTSSNNHARLLADWVFGGEEAFADAAASWLAAKGLTGTTIVEPTGVSPDNRSTIPDLIRIGELALADPVVAGIVAQATAEVPGAGLIEQSNELLGVAGIDGIKTGTTPEAGANLLYSADVEVAGRTVTLVGAVLGGEDHDAVGDAVLAMLASTVDGFSVVTAVEAGERFGEYTTAWGDSAGAVAAGSASFLLWGEESVVAETTLDEVTTADAGERVGTLTVTATRETVTIDLVLDAPLEDPGNWWRWTNPER